MVIGSRNGDAAGLVIEADERLARSRFDSLQGRRGGGVTLSIRGDRAHPASRVYVDGRDVIVSENPLGSVTSNERLPQSVACGSVFRVTPAALARAAT